MLSTQRFQPDKLKELLHYLIHKTALKHNVGKTVLFKLLYFSDFNFYKANYTSITGEEYRKLDHGPAPSHFDQTVKELVEEGRIKVKMDKGGTYDTFRFRSLLEPKIKLLSMEEIKFVDTVLKKLGKLNATQISRLSHLDTPWEASDEKEIISYGLVFYRDDKVSAMVE